TRDASRCERGAVLARMDQVSARARAVGVAPRPRTRDLARSRRRTRGRARWRYNNAHRGAWLARSTTGLRHACLGLGAFPHGSGGVLPRSGSLRSEIAELTAAVWFLLGEPACEQHTS